MRRGVPSIRSASAALLLGLLSIFTAGCGSGGGGWTLPNGDLASARTAEHSRIDGNDVGSLGVAWRFRDPYPQGESGGFTATPVVAGGVVYEQDMKSNVFALDLSTGRLRWRRLFDASNPGPDGLAYSGGRLYGATDAAAFALDAKTGRILWRRFLATAQAPDVDIAPLVDGGLVFVSSIGLVPDGRGVLYALDAATGAIRWRFSTIARPWFKPSLAGGGGAWLTPSVSGGDVYWGIANPYPYGGTPAYPNGGAFAGPALYTDSLVVLDERTGKRVWFDQVTPHDVRDYDFQAPPILETVAGRQIAIGAGKAGRVIAWDRRTHDRLWSVAVGTHRNDAGPLPLRPVSVCPGLLGGVETPMASDGTLVYVPVVNLCMLGSAVGYESLDKVNVAARGSGELVALDASTGRRVWTVHFPQADFGCATLSRGVVFTSTFEGRIYALDAHDGRRLWSAAAPAGINACPAVAGRTLLVPAGVPERPGDRPELVAYTTKRG